MIDNVIIAQINGGVGIDVSVNNGVIDWSNMCQRNVKFAMIKATQGRGVHCNANYFIESQFANNVIGAYRNNIPFGAYHYLTAATLAEADKEADLFISALLTIKHKISLWAAVDVEEDKYLPQDKNLLTAIVDRFCQRVKNAGFEPIIYTNPNYLTYRLNDVSKWDLWLALWRVQEPDIKKYPNLKIWQCGSAKINGVNTDINYMIANADIDYASAVCAKCGLEEQTKTFLNCYKYADYLWQKLYNGMR